jgi:hypothetical protein
VLKFWGCLGRFVGKLPLLKERMTTGNNEPPEYAEAQQPTQSIQHSVLAVMALPLAGENELIVF